jgi:hypothetical protein
MIIYLQVKQTSETKMSNQVSQMTLVTGIMGFIGDKYPELEVNARHYNAIISAANTLTDALNTPHESSKENMGLEAWLVSDEVGMSSKFLAFKLSGSPLALSEYEHPYDPDDFQRCRKMLDAVPELKDKLNIMANESKVWAGLVQDWDLICQLIDDDKCSDAYKLINKNH